jgi:ketosteroid isomerase-like protein
MEKNFMTDGAGFSMEMNFEQPEDVEKSARNQKIILHAFDRMLAGDVDTFWGIFAPDMVFHEAPSLPYGGAHKGIPAAKAAVAKLLSNYESMKTVFEGVAAMGDIVLVYQTVYYRTKVHGNTGSVPVAELYRFRDGKVIEWRALYFDSAAVAQSIASKQ